MQKVLAAIMENNGRLLIAKRKKGDRFAGRWEFPGGKMETGETPEEGLKRELREEFDIEVRVGKFLGSCRHTSAFLSVELAAYRVFPLSGEFKLSDHDEIRWLTPAEIKNYPLTEPDEKLLAKIVKKMNPRKG